jgi:hypothetical protein
VAKAVELLGHEQRRSRVQLEHSLEPDLQVSLASAAVGPFLALQPLMRALSRAEPGDRIEVRLHRDGEQVVYEVNDRAGAQPSPEGWAALEAVCQQESLQLSERPGSLVLCLPVASDASAHSH